MSISAASVPVDAETSGAAHYRPYAAYKDSGIAWLGEIPAHWGVTRLTECLRERRETASDKDHPPLSITKSGIRPQLEKIAKTDHGDNRKRVHVGDYVINSRSDRRGSGGLSRFDGSVTLIALVMTITNAVPRYIHHLLRSDLFQEMFFRLGHGIVDDLWTTRYADIKDQELPSPPISEQHAIAAFLDRETAKIDALVAKTERLIELLQEKRTALITHAVTKGLDPNVPMKDSGVEWLGQVPALWAIAPVYARYEVALGKMLDAKRISGDSPGQYVRNVDVQWDAVNTHDLPQMDFPPQERDRYGLLPGDLLVCEGGEVGRTAIWRGAVKECFYQKAIHRLRPRSCRDTPRFFFYMMYSLAMRGIFAAGSNQNTIDHLTAIKLSHHRLAFPTSDEQCAIAALLDQEIARIDALLTKVHDAIDRLKELRTALLSAAVTGKIDVRETAA